MAPTVTADHLNPQTWSDDQIWEALARRLGHDRRLGVAPGTHRRPQRAADAQLVNEPMLYGRLFLAGEGLTPRRVRRVDSMCSTQVPACPAQTGCTVSSRANPERSCCSDWPRRRTIPLFAAEG